ncbi:hypothetical protein CBM2608_B30110 [Cupriavidus taiwanensis]|nr:hypothetical protein CBM2608_B30110 [Cupriavidus taiwanensis]
MTICATKGVPFMFVPPTVSYPTLTYKSVRFDKK